MTKYPTLYTVTYWAEDVSKCITAHGLLYAETPGDAITQLEDWYGANEISSFSVHMLEAGLFEITAEERQGFLKRYF